LERKGADKECIPIVEDAPGGGGTRRGQGSPGRNRPAMTRPGAEEAEGIVTSGAGHSDVLEHPKNFFDADCSTRIQAD